MNIPSDSFSGLSGEDLAALQEAALAQMIDTCTIERRIVAADSYGSVSETWSTVATGVPLSLSKTKRWAESLQGGVIRAITVWEAFVPVRTDVRAQDRIKPNGVFWVQLGAPTGGAFSLTFGGQTASGIAYNATAAAVESALVALSSIMSSEVDVTGLAGGPYLVWFIGNLAGTSSQLTGSGTALTGADAAFLVARDAYEVTDCDRGKTNAASTTCQLVRVQQ